MEIKYELPPFLNGTLTRKDYVDWLDLKAGSHFDRDRERFGKQMERSRANYKEDIHEAVLRSRGRDFYTCEPLDWSLIGRYDNEEAQRKGSEYKREFALLPTVDHEDPRYPATALQICAWQTNDWKSDLTIGKLKELCRKFLRAQLCRRLRRLFMNRA